MTTTICKKSFKFPFSARKNQTTNGTIANAIKSSQTVKSPSSSSSKKYIKFNNLVYEQIELNLKLNQNEHKSTNSYGFIIAGYCPCHVETVIENSISHNSGLKKGDLIMKINDVNCCRARIKSILSLIKNNQNESLKLTIYRRLADSQLAYRLAKTIAKTSQSSDVKYLSTKQSIQKAKNVKLFSKLLRPSLWLSCAQPSNTTMSSTFIYNSVQLNEQVSVVQSKCLSLAESNNDYIVCTRDCCKSATKRTNSIEKIAKSESALDTGYETLSRYNDKSNDQEETNNQNEDFTIETVTNTTNSYSECDLTVEPVVKSVKLIQEENITKRKLNSENLKTEKYNECRTKLIGDLIEMEANFVSYLSLAVATFSRPLRGFFIKQQDYFTLFQNIEKILIISENFLRSMDKWSAYDLYTKIGQLYTQKMSLFKDAFTIYVKGYAKAKCLLNELKSHSKQFRLFLNEVQSSNLTLSNLIDLPCVHMQKTMEIFKQIRMFTYESKRNPSEAPHIDSVIFELRKILNQLNESNKLELNQACYGKEVYYEDDETEEYLSEDDSTTFFMETSGISSIDQDVSTTVIERSSYGMNSCCSDTMSSEQSSTSNSCYSSL